VRVGDAKSLRKAYHRAAARLHPDKVSGHPLAAQAMAEELFKALGASYQKELQALEGG
jgi:curved DNA-binding protein CbpA